MLRRPTPNPRLPALSRRAHWDAPENRLTIARAQRVARGEEVIDLTNANPTKAGLPYPLDDLAEIMARASRASYDPAPLGIRSAREAVAREVACDADDVVITVSTSEAYSFLFKLLCDAGDTVVTPTPSYPLLEHLAALELIDLRHFALELHKRWELDPTALRQVLTERTRAVIVVNPNNPTGSYVTAAEQDEIARVGLPIISDEVFFPFAFEPAQSAPVSFARDDVLTFVLGGLSKSAGLPHYKLGWIRVSGPHAARRAAINALELIADIFLSAATPVQVALPELLEIAPRIREAIRRRTAANLDTLRRELAPVPAAQLLPIEGGWSAVIRVPRIDSDETLALSLLETQGVVVHPGYFFDFETDGHMVVSLLTEPDAFREGVTRIVRVIPV